MKKKLVALLAALMVFSVGTTVLAASPVASPIASEEVNTSEVTTAKDIKSVAVNEAKVVDKNKPISIEIEKLSTNDEKAVDTAVLENFGTTATVLGSFNLEVTNVKSATVTFEVKDVKAGDKIYCLHQKADGTWERLDTVVAAGTVTVKFTSFSPVVLVKGDPVPTGSTSRVVSVLAMICLAGVVVCGKKVKFNA